MHIVADYRRRATEVKKLAANADQRQAILGIARTWQSLADQREKMIREGRFVPPRDNGGE